MKQSDGKSDSKKVDTEKLQGGVDEILPGEQVVSIPLHKIRPNPFQPRKVFDDIDEIAESIKEEGVLQPIIVRKVADPTSEFLFEILSGERRWRGSKKAGKSHIPAIVREATEEDMKTKAALENTARKDLNFIETMNCYHILVEHYRDTGLVASKVGKSRKHVNEYLKIREEIYKYPKVAEIFEAQARSITYSAAKAFAEVAGKVYRLEKSNNREFQRVLKKHGGRGNPLYRLGGEKGRQVRQGRGSTGGCAVCSPVSEGNRKRTCPVDKAEKNCSPPNGDEGGYLQEHRGVQGKGLLSCHFGPCGWRLLKGVVEWEMQM